MSDARLYRLQNNHTDLNLHFTR